MTHSAEEVRERLETLTRPTIRRRLFARGMARSLIWELGELPRGAPNLGDELTADLLDHGFAVLSEALWQEEQHDPEARNVEAFRVAAEAIETAVRDGPPDESLRGFHLVIAAAAFHLAGFAARSYCLLNEEFDDLTLSPYGESLSYLMQLSLSQLRPFCVSWLRDPSNGDMSVARRLEEGDEFEVEGAFIIALATHFMRALGQLDFALRTGNDEAIEGSQVKLREIKSLASETGIVPVYWYSRLARPVVSDIWGNSLYVRLPTLPHGDSDSDEWAHLRRRFIALLASRDISEVDLWPSQLEAAERSVDPSDDLVVALPTSAGKTRIAELAILRALASGVRVVYITPLRALSAQLEETLRQSFRPLGFTVSSLYGASGVTVADVDVLENYDIVVATPEKLDFSLRQAPELLEDVGLVVLDEGHMIGRGRREVRYEVLIQRLLQREDSQGRRLVCLSAIFSTDERFSDFTAWIRSDEPGEAIESDWRPTRQRFGELLWDFQGSFARLNFQTDAVEAFVPRYVVSQEPREGRRRNPFPQNSQEFTVATALKLVDDGHQVLIYCPQKRSVEPLARTFGTVERQGFFDSLLPEDANIARAMRIGREWLGEEHPALNGLRLGLGVHHGSLPRHFLSEVESLVSARSLPVTIASPTVAQGLDLPCSALVLHSLYRYPGTIPPSEFTNVVGRVGRAFVDLDGITIAPIYEENKRKRRNKRQVYRNLRERAEHRSMESGVLQLIDRIMTILLSRLDTDTETFLEYVLNYDGRWETIGDSADDLEGEQEQLARLIEDLDTVILSAVEDTSRPVNELASVLDQALRNSLWRRQLQVRNNPFDDFHTPLLEARARWLWSNSSQTERAGYFAAGVGHRTGSQIYTNLNVLVEWLVESERALANENIRTASAAVVNLSEVCFDMPPFSPRTLLDNWRAVLRGWMQGEPLSDLPIADPSNAVDFIQQGIVYRLVWAVEAVRVSARAQGHERTELITGATARTLTFGLPTIQSALLAQAGLSSRRMAMRLLEHYPADFRSFGGLRRWLADVQDEIVPGFWGSRESHEVWGNFLARWRNTTDEGEWVSSYAERSVRWTTEEVPDAGVEVQLVNLGTPERTEVVASDLRPLGELDDVYRMIGRPGQVRARVGRDRTSLLIERFGP